jgi:hypothetical protein
MVGDKKLGGSWDVVMGRPDRRWWWLGSASRPALRKEEAVGPLWPKREESQRSAHQLRRTAALLQGGDDQQ